jgi:putative cardiolipin synthase
MPETRTAGRFFEEEMAQHPGKSGFYVLASGESAFRTRIALTRIAEKTIDAQYFIWEADATGALLATGATARPYWSMASSSTS